MKQIYYTQCPMGYGLGASNGFQIKRMSKDYPISGDFRHLGMRAYVSGSRTMAPCVLRYRRNENGEAEVAWLTPRTHEYQTERGLWGRPGGHFAHGIVLGDQELRELKDWPAALFDASCWVREDPVPSRGDDRDPRPFSWNHESQPFQPTFDAFEYLDRGLGAKQLSLLLTAIASAVRDQRTLYLIDDAERLFAHVGLLTLALPEPWRGDLTFSTYHDRPEELHGFRIQGCTPSARPNRNALLANGIVADLAAGAIVPELKPTVWATQLANWVTSRSEGGRAAWTETQRRAAIACSRPAESIRWSDAWLDELYRFDSLVRGEQPAPTEADGWISLLESTRWGAKHGLFAELADARPPQWWKAAATQDQSGHSALLEHLAHPESWRADSRAKHWGQALAAWLLCAERGAQRRMLGKTLEFAPTRCRPDLVRSVVLALPESVSRETTEWLERARAEDRATLLPISVRGAVADLVSRQDSDRVRRILGQAVETPEVLKPVLDALVAESQSHPAIEPRLADLVDRALKVPSRRVPATQFLEWALVDHTRARSWLRPLLTQAMRNPAPIPVCRAIREVVPRERVGPFARAVLEIAGEHEDPNGVFRWAVEEILLALPEEEQPHESAWASLYLDRMTSDLDLFARLQSREFRDRGVPRWLARAKTNGELNARHLARIELCHEFVRALRSGDARTLRSLTLPSVPPWQRGRLLNLILQKISLGQAGAVDQILDVLRATWGAELRAGNPGLDRLAPELLKLMMRVPSMGEAWLDELAILLDRLGLMDGEEEGFEPDGLGAEMFGAALSRSNPECDPWSLRQIVLRHDQYWRWLAADIRREIQGETDNAFTACLERWDHQLDKGVFTHRFYELWLNTCDGPALALSVSAKVAGLKSLEPITWWKAQEEADACPDIRDRFARLSPMRPLDPSNLSLVQVWLRPAQTNPPTDDPDQPLPMEDPGPAFNGNDPELPARFLSRRGEARWRCIELLTAMRRPATTDQARWQMLVAFEKEPWFGEIHQDDRYRFLAWVILSVGEYDSIQLARLASWIYKGGVDDPERVADWVQTLAETYVVTPDEQSDRAAMVRDLREELGKVARDARAAEKKPAG